MGKKKKAVTKKKAAGTGVKIATAVVSQVLAEILLEVLKHYDLLGGILRFGKSRTSPKEGDLLKKAKALQESARHLVALAEKFELERTLENKGGNLPRAKTKPLFI